MSGWQTKRLTDVAELWGRIGWKGLTAKEYTQDGPYFLSVHSLNHGDQVDFREAFHISQERYDESPEVMLQRDDVLICKDGAGIGKVGIVGDMPGPSTINSSMLLLRAKANIVPKYLYHVLQSPYFQQIVQSRLEGATTPHLYQRDISTFPIHLPNLQEQRKIVAALDEAFAVIANASANTERNLADAQLLGRKALQNLLDQQADHWNEVQIRDVAKVESGAGFPEHLQGRSDEAYPFFKVGDMNTSGNEVTMTKANHSISEATRIQLRARVFPVGSVVFPKVGGAIATDKKRLIGRPCCVDNNVMGIIPMPDRLDASLLYQLLKNKPLLEFANDAGLPSIRKSTVESWRVRLPPDVARQRQLAERLYSIGESARELADVYRKKLNALLELKQSLLHDAFSGELSGLSKAMSASANDNLAMQEFTAQILAFAHDRHLTLGRSANFGHVKAQKTLHAVEAFGGLDLGRLPIRDAAGPNDFTHMRHAEDWAASHRYFKFVRRANGGYDFRKLENYDELLDKAKQRLAQVKEAKNAIELLVDMDSDWAEIVVTTHAAWNNLILDHVAITDSAIVKAARYDWHPHKLRHDESRFHDAIRFIRNHGIEPDGSAKRVGGQESLPL